MRMRSVVLIRSALEQKALERVDTSFLDGDSQDGVESYELFDLDGRVLRPISRLNEYTNDPVSIQIKEWFSKNKNIKDARILSLEGGKIGIGKQIFIYDPKTGTQESVGIIAIRFAPTTLTSEASKSTRLYLESLITSLLVGILFFGIVYYLTLRPIEELRFQIEEGLRGKRRSVDSKLLFEELGQLEMQSIQDFKEYVNFSVTKVMLIQMILKVMIHMLIRF